MATTATTPTTTTASATVASAPTAAVAVPAVVVAAGGGYAPLVVVPVLFRGGPNHHRGAEDVGGAQARHQPRHHLGETLTLLASVRIRRHDASTETRRSSSNSSSGSWALCITAIASSQERTLRAERAM